MSTNRIVWLASYPKSGNTWFRIFLANLLSDKDEPQDVNNLEVRTPIASSRCLFDQYLGIDSADLYIDEVRHLQPHLYPVLASHASDQLFMKTHEAFTTNRDGLAMHPKESSQLALYFVRNPLDVAISFANHIGKSLDEAIDRMQRPSFYIGVHKHSLNDQIPQQLLSWSGHVSSWIDNVDVPVLVMRYEDMLAQPFDTFKKAVRAMQLEYSDADIKQALEFSRFDRLQSQERKHGFKEKPQRSAAFFRSGKSGEWQERLSEAQVEAVVMAHQPIMQRFGYWD